MKIVVAGTGYVGLSMAILLAQNNKVTAVDIIPEKVEMLNNRKSPIQDDYIEDYLVRHNMGSVTELIGALEVLKLIFLIGIQPSSIQ